MKNLTFILVLFVLLLFSACKKEGVDNLKPVGKDFADLPDNGSGNSFSSTKEAHEQGNDTGSGSGDIWDVDGDDGGDGDDWGDDDNSGGDDGSSDDGTGDDGSGGDGIGAWQIISNTITVDGSSVNFDEDEVDVWDNELELLNLSDNVWFNVASDYYNFSQGLTITKFSLDDWSVDYSDENNWYEADEDDYSGGEQGSITVSEFSTTTNNEVKSITLKFNNLKCSDWVDVNGDYVEKTITINGAISISR